METASAADMRAVNIALLDAAARLVDELDEVPAGVVLVCFSRAVRAVRRAGCPVDHLAAESDRLARELVAARGVHLPRPRGVPARVAIA